MRDICFVPIYLPLGLKHLWVLTFIPNHYLIDYKPRPRWEEVPLKVNILGRNMVWRNDENRPLATLAPPWLWHRYTVTALYPLAPNNLA
jgi:hypothetical protein